MNPQLEELACLYVLDRLEPGERSIFEERLPRDPELAALVAELESTLGRAVRALPQGEPPGGSLADIEARIDLNPAVGASAPRSRERERVDPTPTAEFRINQLPSNGASGQARRAVSLWVPVLRWGIAAVIAVGVGVIAVEHLRPIPAVANRPFVIVVGLDSQQSRQTRLPLSERLRDADASFVKLASLAGEFWDKPSDLPVKLGSNVRSGRGYALFDPASGQGFIGVRQLPAIESGRRYRLWILDTASGQAREAGVLPAAGSGSGLYSFFVAPAVKAVAGRLDFFVTVEDAVAPASARPSGNVVLGDPRTF